MKEKEFKKTREINRISVNLDQSIIEELEEKQLNKSKLINFLLEDFFEKSNFKDILKKFSRKNVKINKKIAK